MTKGMTNIFLKSGNRKSVIKSTNKAATDLQIPCFWLRLTIFWVFTIYLKKMVGPGDPRSEMAGNAVTDFHHHIVFESDNLFVRMKRKTRKGNHFLSL